MGAEQAGEGRVKAEEQAGNSPGTIPGPDIIAYNLRREERPGGMKARYKVKIETGRKARELDERQASVIRELLHWGQHRPSRAGT
jgi:hypothetical protein